MEQFIGIPADPDTLSDNVDTIGGATVSSSAFIGGVKSVLEHSKNVLGIAPNAGDKDAILAAAAAASGGSVSAGGMYTVAALFSNLLIRFSKGIVYPAVYGYLALALTDSTVQEERLKKLRELIGWCIRNALRIMMYLFTGFLAVTGIISGAADAAALKAAKVTMSGMIPVVGGIVSEAAETVLAGAGLLKSAVGTYGMIAVTAIFLLPFIRMGMQFLAFKMTAALSGVLGSRICGLLDAVAEAMGFVLAMTASAVLMSLLSCCCLMKVSGL